VTYAWVPVSNSLLKMKTPYILEAKWPLNHHDFVHLSGTHLWISTDNSTIQTLSFVATGSDWGIFFLDVLSSQTKITPACVPESFINYMELAMQY